MVYITYANMTAVYWWDPCYPYIAAYMDPMGNDSIPGLFRLFMLWNSWKLNLYNLVGPWAIPPKVKNTGAKKCQSVVCCDLQMRLHSIMQITWGRMGAAQSPRWICKSNLQSHCNSLDPQSNHREAKSLLTSNPQEIHKWIHMGC